MLPVYCSNDSKRGQADIQSVTTTGDEHSVNGDSSSKNVSSNKEECLVMCHLFIHCVRQCVVYNARHACLPCSDTVSRVPCQSTVLDDVLCTM